MFSLGTNYRWSYIFEVMETNKVTLKLNDYSVSQTTLEQVNILTLSTTVPGFWSEYICIVVHSVIKDCYQCSVAFFRFWTTFGEI